jgi:hypothetical protein
MGYRKAAHAAFTVQARWGDHQTAYEFREFVAAGGLLSYGSSIADVYQLAGVYTGRTRPGKRGQARSNARPPRPKYPT